MSARNPYERRRGDRGDREDRDWTALGLEPVRAESPLTLDDLEALVMSAVQRSQRRSRPAHDQAIHSARREAWEEGRRMGQGDGRAALLGEIDAQFGGQVRIMLDDTEATLRGMEGRELGTGDALVLRTRLASVVGLLANLISAHHRGFEELP